MTQAQRRLVVGVYLVLRAITWAAVMSYGAWFGYRIVYFLVHYDAYLDFVAGCHWDIPCLLISALSLRITDAAFCYVTALIIWWNIHSCWRQILKNGEESDNAKPPLDAVVARDATSTGITHTIYFPGLGGDLTQFARYAGRKGFHLHDNGGTHVYHRDAANLFPNPWLGGVKGDGSDVEPHGVVRHYGAVAWFCSLVIPVEMRAYVSGVQGGYPMEHRFTEYCFGQEADVEQGLRVVRAAMAEHSAGFDRFILFGTSRGAAVALQVAAKLTPEEAARVKLVVLEGVFTNVPDVLTYRFGHFLANLIHKVLPVFTQYRPSRPTPLDAATSFPHKELPVAVVTSQADDIVDPKMGKTIHGVLSQKTSAAHLLELRESPHSGYSTDNKGDREMYATFLQGLYDKYLTGQ